MEWMILPLKRYLEFGGRSRRKEFWMFILFSILVGIAAGIVDAILGYGSGSSYAAANGVHASFRSNGPVGGLTSLALLIPSLAVTFRRLHDTDRSAWWLLLTLLPVIGWIALIVYYCIEGTPGPNRFGADPKGANLSEVFR